LLAKIICRRLNSFGGKEKSLMKKLKKPLPKHSEDVSVYIDFAQIGAAIGGAVSTAYNASEAWAQTYIAVIH
jgi:hypothetical protein